MGARYRRALPLECSSFMTSHLRYKRTVVSAARQEQYYQEIADIARRLGVWDIPVTPRQVADYGI